MYPIKQKYLDTVISILHSMFVIATEIYQPNLIAFGYLIVKRRRMFQISHHLSNLSTISTKRHADGIILYDTYDLRLTMFHQKTNSRL